MEQKLTVLDYAPPRPPRPRPKGGMGWAEVVLVGIGIVTTVIGAIAVVVNLDGRRPDNADVVGSLMMTGLGVLEIVLGLRPDSGKKAARTLPLPSSGRQMLTVVDVNEVASELPTLLARVRAGEEVVIFDAGQPVAKILPPGQ